MRSVVLFVEDECHRSFIVTVVSRLAQMERIGINVIERTSTGGFGQVTSDLKRFLGDVAADRSFIPDLVIVATDSNCKGVAERRKAIQKNTQCYPGEILHAIPDPHVERWLLQDSRAFKSVFDIGCDAPDQKCAKDRYKRVLAETIGRAGVRAHLGGVEYAEDIARAVDLNHIQDPQLRSFVESLRKILRSWRE
jgi:hypothetical protein